MASSHSGVAASSNAASDMPIIMSDSEKKFAIAACRANCRVDGRTRTAFRPYLLEPVNDNLPLCHGAARLLGSVGHAWHDTQHLLCTVKAELVRPMPQAPSQGVLEVHLGSQSQAHNNKRDLEHAQNVLTQLLVTGSSSLVDVAALCVQPGHVVWKVAVDIWILESAGGSLLDTCARVLIAALQSTRLPTVTPTTTALETSNDGTARPVTSTTTAKKDAVQVEGDFAKSVPMPLVADPAVIVTVAVLLDHDVSTQRPNYTLVVDATLSEEAAAMALVHCCLVRGRLIRVHKTHAGALPHTLLPEIIGLAEASVAASQQAYRHSCTSSSRIPQPSSTGGRDDLLLPPQFQWRQQQEVVE